jgi:hypothetical protein
MIGWKKILLKIQKNFPKRTVNMSGEKPSKRIKIEEIIELDIEVTDSSPLEVESDSWHEEEDSWHEDQQANLRRNAYYRRQNSSSKS